MLFSFIHLISDRILIVWQKVCVIFEIYSGIRFINLVLVYTVNLEYGTGFYKYVILSLYITWIKILLFRSKIS